MEQLLTLLREFSTLIAAVIGVVVGALTSAFTTRSNRKSQERQLHWQAEQQRLSEVRGRADGKAVEILGLLQELDRLLARRIIMSRDEIVAREDVEELRYIREQIAVRSAFLPGQVREQVDSVSALISEAGRLSYMRYVDHAAQVVVRISSRAAQAAIGQYLRGESVSEPPDHVQGYLDALREMEHQDAVEIERQIAGYDQQQGVEASGERSSGRSD